MRSIILFAIFIFFYSCNESKPVETPVAQVFETTLYNSEISDFIPEGTSHEDSLLMAQNYIRNWVTQKLLLHKAIENLSGEEKSIRKQVEDYRTSLLIHQYKQKLISQRLAADISDTDVENYYKGNENNFILATPIVKAVFFILSKNAPNLKDVERWYKSDREKDQESLEEYCLTNAKKYDKFKDKWIEAKYLLNLIPGDFNTLEREIDTQDNIRKEDDENYYFLKIKAIRREQTIAPPDYVRDEIILILKNKKKLQFETDLEKQINEEGIKKDYVKIY
ncbi:MAG: peptidyl-prolyl cis-trans isomerase [Odoribacter sp.]